MATRKKIFRRCTTHKGCRAPGYIPHSHEGWRPTPETAQKTSDAESVQAEAKRCGYKGCKMYLSVPHDHAEGLAIMEHDRSIPNDNAPVDIPPPKKVFVDAEPEWQKAKRLAEEETRAAKALLEPAPEPPAPEPAPETAPEPASAPTEECDRP